MKISVSILAIFLSFFVNAQNSNVQIKTEIDKVINNALQEKRIVGAVIIVAKNGKVIYQNAAGFADREEQIKMEVDDIFLLASITKPMVSAVAMKFVEDGKISLQDNVSKYLPDFKPKLENGETPKITIRQLLTHTSGLSYRFIEKKGSEYDQLNISDGLDQPGLSIDENLERISKAHLKFAPGTKWNYSLSMDVLGKILEKVSGKSLANLVAQYVTEPLNMKNTGFEIVNKTKLATFYADGKPEPIKMYAGIEVPIFEGICRFDPGRILNSKSYQSGGGGMAGTAPDLLKFFENIRLNKGKILKRETVKEMMQDQVGKQAEAQGPGWGFGYGWAVLSDPKIAKSPMGKGTIQWGGAYGHRWFIDPANKLTVIALTNTTFEGMNGAFPEEITKAVYENLD